MYYYLEHNKQLKHKKCGLIWMNTFTIRKEFEKDERLIGLCVHQLSKNAVSLPLNFEKKVLPPSL